MTTDTPQPITTPPSGHSIHNASAVVNGRTYNWRALWSLENGRVHLTSFEYWLGQGLFVRDDSGAVVFDNAVLDALDYSLVFIPDSQLPADMSLHHTEFNAETQKYQLPNILDRVRKRHEGDRDFDVHSALFDFHNSQNRITYMRFQMAEAVRNAAAADVATTRARHVEQINAYNTVRDTHLSYAFEIVLTEAHIDSLNYFHPSDTTDADIDAAHQWAVSQAATLLAELQRRAALPTSSDDRLRADCTDYVARFSTLLTADGQHAADASERTWPRDVRWVAALSTGAKADSRERTLASAFTLVGTALNPPA